MKNHAIVLGVKIPEVLRKLENSCITSEATFLEAHADTVILNFLRDKDGENTLSKSELALVILAGAEALRKGQAG